MNCLVQTHLDAPAGTVWNAVKHTATLLYVTRGFLGFSGHAHLPAEWDQDTIFQTRFWFFHILPAWWQHTLAVEQLDENRRVIVSREQGGFIRVWKHTIHISPGLSGCDYTDSIEIEAGWLTILVWLYANIFYRYRQARWRRLAKKLVRSGKI